MSTVREHGAVGDGLSDCTAAFQRAVDSCAAQGGGEVRVDAGVYRIGTVLLKDHVAVCIEHGARIEALDDPAAYRPLGRHDERRTANPQFSAMFGAVGVGDIALRGAGLVHGGGHLDRCPSWREAQGLFRPAMVYFEDCERVDVAGVALDASRWWTLHLLRCRDVGIHGVRMRSNWPNSDGIDPDGCCGVRISDCQIDTGDDSIVLKSTQGDACEDVLVSNCVLKSTCVCFKLGTESLVLSETSGSATAF